MTSGFLERAPEQDSWLASREARAKLLLVGAAVIAAASEPAGALGRFPYYAALIVLLLIAGRIAPRTVAIRLAAAAPFLLAAASAPWISRWMGEPVVAGGLAVSILLRAFAAVALLTVLIETTATDDLLHGLRRLHAPRTLSAVVVLMYRYLFLLFEEWRRMTAARRCRAAGRLRVPKSSFFAKQIGLVFLRAWERAERVQAAMDVRGFTGELPVRGRSEMTAADWATAVLGAAAFWTVRLAL